MIDVEAYIVFLAACFFTLLWFMTKVNEKPNNVMGAFSGISWITLGFLWIFLAYEPAASGISYGTYAIALLFNGVGIMMIVMVIIDLLSMRSLGRKLTGDED